jgi:phospholipase D1/2
MSGKIGAGERRLTCYILLRMVPHKVSQEMRCNVQALKPCTALHATGDVEAKDKLNLLKKAGLKSKNADARAADKSLEEERQTFSLDGKKEHGFASSVVPTLEEKLIAENHLKSSRQGNGQAHNGHADPQEAQIDGELFGAPANANANPERDDQVPGTREERHTELEEKAVEARSIIRKHLGASFSKHSALPTPTPHVDPHGFEDPVCDEFWKGVWVACAAHNVSCYSSLRNVANHSTKLRLRYIARCSMQFLMI